MANTLIQIKRSTATGAPGFLNVAEPGYSYASGKLYIGNAAGTGVETIGGNVYTTWLDAGGGPSSSNNANSIVKRDLAGNFSAGTISANLAGRASTANTWQNARLLGVSGDATGVISVDGSANANIPLVLAPSGVAAGSYGNPDGSALAYIVVDAKGRITAAGNAAVAAGSSFNFKGNTGVDTSAAGDSINMYGINGLEVYVTANTGNTIVTVNADSTFVKTAGNQTIGGIKTFTNEVVIQGDLTVTGTRTFSNSATLLVGDNIFVLNADLPIAGSPTEHAGMEVMRGASPNTSVIWDETNDVWTFTNDGTVFRRMVGNNELASAYTQANTALLGAQGAFAQANTALLGAQGAFAQANTAQITGGNAYGVANTALLAAQGAFAQANAEPLAVVAYGRANNAFTNAQAAFAQANVAQTTGGNAYGVANSALATAIGAFARANAEPIAVSAFGVANTALATAIGAFASANTIDAKVAGANANAANATYMTTGILAVGFGGTGVTSFTANGVLYGAGSGAIRVTAAPLEGQLLQGWTNTAPIFAMLDGGSF